MSVYFYFPLNFTHCWVSLLTDCLWWCWRSTNTAEEAVHITLPRCSISPCRTSTYLISWYEAHSHPFVRICNLPPTWECGCLMHLSGCSCGHPKTTCMLCVRREEKKSKTDPACTLKALSTFVSHVYSAFKSILLYSFFLKFPNFNISCRKSQVERNMFKPPECRI